jgi:phosphopantetheine--protein transferase-like protein
MTATCIEVFCCPLPAVDPVLLAQYENLLNEEELQRLRSFHSPSAANEFLAGRALLRTSLAARLQCGPRELQFTKNADGKPALSHPQSVWQFNLSHSHDWVVLALCEGAAIGIDIESCSRRNNLQAIAQRYFSTDENARLAQLTNDEWSDYFFAVWTLKEAHAKALGCGLPKIFSCSSIAVDFTAQTIDLKLSGVAATTGNVSSWLYRLDKDVVLAVIAHGEKFEAPQISHCVPQHLAELITPALRAHGYGSPEKLVEASAPQADRADTVSSSTNAEAKR